MRSEWNWVNFSLIRSTLPLAGVKFLVKLSCASS